MGPSIYSVPGSHSVARRTKYRQGGPHVRLSLAKEEKFMRITINLILMLALVSTPAVAANLFVPTEYGTIQDAVDAAFPGDRILVAAGEYVGAAIDIPVTILGVGDATVIVHGPNRPAGSIWFQNGFRLTAGADGTKIGHLKIKLSAT